MAKLNKAFKFRLYTNKEQQGFLAKTFGCVRFVYNKMLAERKETYIKKRLNNMHSRLQQNTKMNFPS